MKSSSWLVNIPATGYHAAMPALSIPQRTAPVILALLLTVFFPDPVHAASGNIILDSPVYRYLETLDSYGLLTTYLSGHRPITWSEAYRLMEEGRFAVSGGEDSRETPEKALVALRDLERAVLRRFEGDTGPFTADMLKSAEIGLSYLEGETSSIPVIKASQHALEYNNEGIDPDKQGTAYTLLELEGVGGPAAFQLYPRITTGKEDRNLIHRGVLKLGSDRFEISAGKESLWWGQGNHGGLFLTNNANPLSMVRITNPTPIRLPYVFKHMGPFSYDLFLSRLEGNRAVPEPWFSGIRLSFRPARVVELGLNMMIMAGGEGRPGVSPGDLFDILFGENEIGGEDRSNKIAGIDFRMNLDGWQVYGELGGEDEAGNLPSKDSLLLGMFIPGFTRSLDLRVEYADFALTEEIAGVWYRHGVYTDGYTYEGRLLGHHVGGDGKDLFAEVIFNVGERGVGRVGIDLEQRGIHLQPVVERHVQVSAGWERRFHGEGKDWGLELGAALDRVSNKDYTRGEKDILGIMNVSVSREM
jgi:hypothetical protein